MERRSGRVTENGDRWTICLWLQICTGALLIAFELCPVDVALVVFLKHDLPFAEGLSLTIGLARAPVDERRALLAFSVDLHSSIEGILDHGDDVTIAERSPFEGDHPLAVGRAREVDPIGPRRQQRLPRAAPLAEARKNAPDHLLQAQVGVEAEADLAMPNIADGHMRECPSCPGLAPPGFAFSRLSLRSVDGGLEDVREVPSGRCIRSTS
jgi:hypothetical protein